MVDAGAGGRAVDDIVVVDRKIDPQVLEQLAARFLGQTFALLGEGEAL
jgi:hypothetical protein